MFNPHTSSSGRLIVKKLIMQESNVYHDMVRRPWQMAADERTVNCLSEVTQGGRFLDHNHVAPVAGQMLRPAAQTSFMAGIENGWGTTRFFFMMAVEVASQFAPSEEYIVSGYSDFCDVSHQTRSLPPELKMFVNNIVTVRQMHTSLGTQLAPVDVSQVLRGNYLSRRGNQQTYPGAAPVNDYTMRPVDLFQFNANAGLIQQNAGPVDDIQYTPSMFHDGAKLSSRDNNLASRFLSKTLVAQQSAMAYDPYSAGDDFIIPSAGGRVVEQTWNSNSLLHMLSKSTQICSPAHGYFTWQELCMLDPNASNTAVVSLNRQGGVQRIHQPNATEFWTSATNETVAASILTNAVPALMARMLLTRVAFTATNATVDGSVVVQWTPNGAHGFYENMDMGPALSAFENQFIHEVFSSVSCNGMHSVSLMLDVRLIGDMYMTISMNGQAAVPFNAPLFADQLFTPVMTNDYQYLTNMSHDISSVASMVVEPAAIMRG